MTKAKKTLKKATLSKEQCRKSDKKLDIVEIAKKKRHLKLLEKVQQGSALSSGELRELKKLEKGANISAGQVASIEEVGEAFGVSVRTVQRWINSGMPQGENGEFDLIDIQAWRFAKSNKGDSQNDKQCWEETYRKFKALLAEIQYKKAVGELVLREEVVATMMNRIVAIKRQFLALPQRVAPQLEGLDIVEREALLTERLKEIIKGFADGKY